MNADSMLKLVSDAALDNIGAIDTQAKRVEDEVLNPIKMFGDTIQGGAWQGEDADAFYGELFTVVLPMVADLIAAIGGISGGFGGALEGIMGADSSALGIVDDLVGDFDSIF